MNNLSKKNFFSNLLVIIVISIICQLLIFKVFSNLSIPSILLIVLVLVITIPLLLHYRYYLLNTLDPWIFVFTGFFVYYLLPCIDLSIFRTFGEDVFKLNYYGHISSSDDILITKVFSCILVGVISTYLGYNFSLGKQIAYSFPKINDKWNKHKFKLIIFLLFFFFIIFTILAIIQSGGLSVYFQTQRGSRLYLRELSIYSSFLSGVLFLPVMMLSFVYSNIYKSRFIFYQFVLSFLFFSILSFSMYGSRRIFIFSILAFLVYRFYSSRIKLYKFIFLFLILFLFILFSAHLRPYMHLGVDNIINEFNNIISVDRQQFYNLVRMSMDFPYTFDAFISIIDKVPKSIDYLYGKSYAKFLFMFIPRSIWIEKPITISRIVPYYFYDKDLYLSGASINPTIMGEAYFNFGLIGIIIIMLFFGLLVRIVTCYIRKHKKNKSVIMIYALMSSYFIDSFRGYFFETTLSTLSVIIVMMFAINYISNGHLFLKKKNN